MQEPPWMPRTEEEYRQQVAEDAGPQPDEWIRLRQALDATEEEVARLQMVRDALQRDARAAAERERALREKLLAMTERFRLEGQRRCAAEAREATLREAARALVDGYHPSVFADGVPDAHEVRVTVGALRRLRAAAATQQQEAGDG